MVARWEGGGMGEKRDAIKKYKLPDTKIVTGISSMA